MRLFQYDINAMTDLKSLFFSLGIEKLDLSSEDQALINQFISSFTPRFLDICQQRPDRAPLDLLLGLMTQQHKRLSQQWQTQQQAYHQMQSVFENTVGADHASKFQHQESEQYTIVSLLWLLVQGASQIDYSYANEQAETICQQLFTTSTTMKSADSQAELLRQRLMQAYYLGKKSSQQSLVTKLKNWFKS